MLQKIKSLSLERQLFLSFSAVSALLLMLSLGITLYFDIARQSQSIDSTISSTAAYVASMDGVAEMLANGYPTQEVTGSLDSLHQNFPGIDIIAVYDRNGLRFYHTSRLETGETFVAGEETAILSGSPPYITTGYGTHGNRGWLSMRSGTGLAPSSALSPWPSSGPTFSSAASISCCSSLWCWAACSVWPFCSPVESSIC